MLNKAKNYLSGLALAAFAFALTAVPASAQYVSTPIDEEGAVTIITDMVGTVSGTLGGGLPIIFALLATLAGLFFVVRQVMKRVGRAK
jgi:hypothetical protein